MDCPAVRAPGAAEIIVAPVTITPTKPLTPTHVKGLLWTDVLVRATSLVTPTRLVWNPRLAHLTSQTIAFWEHLDRTAPDVDWAAESESAIGARYVGFHRDRPAVDPRALDPYFARIETTGWMHPAGRRMLGLWRRECDLLGVADPGFTADRPLGWSTERTFAELAARRMLIDHRRFGGPLYLDGPRWGVPVRQLAGADSHANYLVPILRELLPLIGPGRLFLLIFDEGLAADYLLLDRVLTEFGADVVRLPLSRVAIGGAVLSSRHGGWSGVTLADLSAVHGSADAAAYRLGMRQYFVGVLDRRSKQSFRMDLLRRCVGRAARSAALDRPDADVPVTPRGYADPRRLVIESMGRHPRRLPERVVA